MNITMLGTGNAMVTEVYNTCFVLEDKGKYFLVDGGGGSELLARLKHAGIDWKNVREIFVTHKHIDHILGILWMIRLICQGMSRGQYEGDAFIYGHSEVIQLLRELSDKLLSKKMTCFIDERLHLITVRDGEWRRIIGHEVTFFDIGSTKAKQFGFTMNLDSAEDMAFDKGKGGKLTCCGDEPYSDLEYTYAQGSKWLLHEAFCLHSQAEVYKPYEKHHSTAKDAAKTAETLGVKNLILYHTEDDNIARRKELYAEEAQRYFFGNVYVPDDLERIEL